MKSRRPSYYLHAKEDLKTIHPQARCMPVIHMRRKALVHQQERIAGSDQLYRTNTLDDEACTESSVHTDYAHDRTTVTMLF